MSQAYLGEVRLFGLNYAPVNWLACEGQIMAITQNSALFSLIGTMYGGNGTTTFALPDLRGRTTVGAGTPVGGDPYVPGEMGGELALTLLGNQVPAHTHGINACGLRSVADLQTPTATSGYAKTTSCAPYANAGSPKQVLASMFALPPAYSTNPLPHDNMAPWITVQYNICINGTFPPRS